MEESNMSKFSKLVARLSVLTVLLTSFSFAADAPKSNGVTKQQNLRFGVVNFKRCVENSKMGKQEQANFEKMKNQMESVLSEKEKTLIDMEQKLNDADYLDSLSPEAETELKRKFRGLSQELAAQQQQFMQTLQQTNLKVIQQLNDAVVKAAKQLSVDEKLDLVFNEEATFVFSPDLDFSTKVIAMLDADFEKDAAKSSEKK